MRKSKYLAALAALIMVVLLCGCGNSNEVADNGEKAEASIKAEALMEAGEYKAASEIFGQLGDYKRVDEATGKTKEASKLYKQCLINYAYQLETNRDYKAAADIYEQLGSYQLKIGGKNIKSANQYTACTYAYAAELMDSLEYDLAANTFDIVSGYEDSVEMANECRYLLGAQYLEKCEYADAFSVYDTIRSYKDTEKTIEDNAELMKARAQKYAVGKTVSFGSYNQEANAKAQPIEWIVLASNDTQVLLLSKNALRCKQFNTNCTATIWNNSTMRNFLNNEFLNVAFSEAEKRCFITDMNGIDITAAENVFILSDDEIKKYVRPEDLICKATGFAASEGVWTDNDGACWWWLRDVKGDHAQLIDSDGKTAGNRFYVNYGHAGARPAIRIDITK